MNVEIPMTVPVETNDFLAKHGILMANSFERLLSRPLIEPTSG
jgi:hypothetical protein